MRILMLVHKFPPSVGGIQTLAFNLAKELVKGGHEVTVWTSMDRDRKKYEVTDGIRIHRFMRLDGIGIFPNYFTLGMIKRLPSARIYAFDIIHTFSTNMFPPVFGAILSRVWNKPLVVWACCHGPEPMFDEIQRRFVLNSASVVIAQCKQEAESLLRYVPPGKMRLIPCGINVASYVRLPAPENFRKRYGIGSDRKIILYVGSLGRHKQVSNFVSLLPPIVKKVPDVTAVIIGGGQNRRNIELQIQEMNLSANVLMLSNVSDDEVIDAYASANVFVLPSQSESYGIVLLESAASGIPIVSTNVGAAMEIVQDGVTGFVREHVDDEFANATVKALTDENIRANAVACRDKIIDEYSWCSITDKLEDVYQEITSRSRPQSLNSSVRTLHKDAASGLGF